MQEENTLLKDVNAVYRGIKSTFGWLVFILFWAVVFIVVYATMCSRSDKGETETELYQGVKEKEVETKSRLAVENGRWVVVD